MGRLAVAWRELQHIARLDIDARPGPKDIFHDRFHGVNLIVQK